MYRRALQRGLQTQSVGNWNWIWVLWTQGPLIDYVSTRDYILWQALPIVACESNLFDIQELKAYARHWRYIKLKVKEVCISYFKQDIKYLLLLLLKLMQILVFFREKWSLFLCLTWHFARINLPHHITHLIGTGVIVTLELLSRFLYWEQIYNTVCKCELLAIFRLLYILSGSW